MGRNGERHPRRPRIELVTEPATEGEAVAIVAAMEQFLAETAPRPSAGGLPASRWQRAALEEGVSARGRIEHGRQPDEQQRRTGGESGRSQDHRAGG